MRSKSERLKVEINESSTVDIRTFNITLTAPASDFQLTDLLKQRGVINGLESELKQAIKSVLETYLQSAERLISGLATSTNGTRKRRAKSTINHVANESIYDN